MINKLEKKLGMLQGLDPVMEHIVSDLNNVTDFRTIRRQNAKWDHNNSARFGKINGADYSGSESEEEVHNEVE